MSQTGPNLPHSFDPPTIGQILDRIFRLFRAHFLLFMRIASVLIAGLVLTYGAFGAAMFASRGFAPAHSRLDPFRVMMVLVPMGFVSGLAFTVIHAVFEAAATHAGLEADLGIKSSFREAYGVALKNAGRYVWLMVLRNLVLSIPILICNAIFGGLALWFFRSGPNLSPAPIFFALPLLFLAYLGCTAYMILMGLRLSLGVPACVAENIPAVEALKRSLGVTKNAMGRIFVVLLVVYAAGYGAFLVLEMVGFAFIGGGALFWSMMHIHPGHMAVAIAIGLAALLFIGAMFLWIAALMAGYAIAFAVLYHDQRRRVDGVASMAPAGEPI